jgi:hypothetical protein
MLRAMADDPWQCAECYNRAVTAMPEAGIAPLLVRDDYVELPLWRIREDGRRMHAYDSDVAAALGNGECRIQESKSEIALMPRALFMTALVRLGMCDLFIHGFGGANYDRAMEAWIRQWLGVDVATLAMATADMRLPLMATDTETGDVARAQTRARRLWHDPSSADGNSHPSAKKQSMFQAIEDLPRDSTERRAAFLAMHTELARGRSRHEQQLAAAWRQLEQARRHAADLAIAQRRDWAFSLYPHAMIDELASQARGAAGCDH